MVSGGQQQELCVAGVEAMRPPERVAAHVEVERIFLDATPARVGSVGDERSHAVPHAPSFASLEHAAVVAQAARSAERPYELREVRRRVRAHHGMRGVLHLASRAAKETIGHGERDGHGEVIALSERPDDDALGERCRIR